MSRGKSKNKRKINEGLRRYNQVRSFISKEKKSVGAKYSNIELNSLTKEFLKEHWGASFSDKDISSYIRSTTKDFYATPTQEISLLDIADIQYYDIDKAIYLLPKLVDVVINAGSFGYGELNTDSFTYDGSVAQDIVSEINKVKPESGEYTFSGFIKEKEFEVKEGKKKRKVKREYVYFALQRWGDFVDGVDVSDVKIPEGKGDRTIEKKTIKKKLKEKIQKSSTKKLDIKEKQIELEIEKQKTERAKTILELLKQGLTKEDLKNAGLL